jgi:hypothetical protein
MDSRIASDSSDAATGSIVHFAGDSSSPVWASIHRDILCPLCDYNLRGLIDPRCPECGYQFDWEPLLNPTSNTHTYLFEHHPEKNVRSFIRTAIGTLTPGKFWSSLRADQAVRTGRLLAYWCVCNLIPLLLGVGWLVADRMNLAAAQASAVRATPSPWLGRRYTTRSFVPTTSFVSYSYRHRGPHFAVIDLTSGQDYPVGAFLWSCLANVLFSGLLFVGLMGFQASMKLARIKPIHVLRCVVYSTDAIFWVGMLLMVALATAIVWRQILPPPIFQFRILDGELLDTLLPLLPVIYALIASWRLSVAYSRYLQFRHPVATVLSVQFILLLIALIVRSVVYTREMGG